MVVVGPFDTVKAWIDDRAEVCGMVAVCQPDDRIPLGGIEPCMWKMVTLGEPYDPTGALRKTIGLWKAAGIEEISPDWRPGARYDADGFEVVELPGG